MAAVSSYVGLHNHFMKKRSYRPSPHNGDKPGNELICNAAQYLCATLCIPVDAESTRPLLR